MSPAELERLEAMHALQNRTTTQAKVARRLGLTVRQVKRLWRAFRTSGERGLVSKRRGRASNRRHPAEFVEHAVSLVQQHYADFGPTFASEMLLERHDLRVDRETLRKAMVAAGLWKAKKRRRRYHPPRERRPRFGELVQIDGSPHAWFEDRGPRCTLLVFIDDATSQLVALRFAPAETTNAYFTLCNEYFERSGLPEAFYSDRFSVFRKNHVHPSPNDLTHFARAMEHLNVQLICANSPQAKGRVERANQTLQDRLVKELRLANICDIEAGNVFLAQYRLRHNARFAVAALDPSDAHEPLPPEVHLDRILVSRAARKLSKDLLVQYRNVVYQITATARRAAFPRALVQVVESFDGRITIERNGTQLPFKLNRARSNPPIRNAKDLGLSLRSRSTEPSKKPRIPAPNHPWRQHNDIEAQRALSRERGHF